MIILTGKVIHGQGYGRELGYPTANLDRREYMRKKLKVRLGVWAGQTKIENYGLRITDYRAAIVIGPIDAGGLPKIEAHLINFKGNLYGKKITITLKKYLRLFKKFKNIEELKNQIKKDIKKVKELKYG